MKKEFSERPEFLKDKEMYGFSWLEHLTAIPSPLVLVTSYKDNGKSNATLQSWTTFSNDNDFYCIFANVNKNGHMYKTILKNKSLVVNFPSENIYKKCLETIKNNNNDNDEILDSNLTIEPSTKVNAPRIKECFLNLECTYVWDKELYPNSNYVVVCVKVLNVAMDERYYNDLGRYGEAGYLYNIHLPYNPDTNEFSETKLGLIKTYKSYDEL